jgi:hypothetical protein
VSRNQFENENPFEKVSSISELLGQLAGAASVAWSEPPGGVFESTWAAHLVDQAEIQLAKIQERQYSSDTPALVVYALDYANYEQDINEEKGRHVKLEIVNSLIALGVPRLKALEWVQ